MEADLALVLGLVIAMLAIPAILSAMTDGRGPRASALTLLIAGGLILFALQTKAGGYRLSEIPDVFLRVIADFIP